MLNSDTEKDVENKVEENCDIKNNNIFNELEPIDLFNQMLQCVMKKVKISNKPTQYYSNIRIYGVKIIKSICKQYNINDKVYHSSINLLDELYINKKYTEDIQKVSFVCLIITIKMIEKGDYSVNLIDCIIQNHKLSFYPFFEKDIIQIMNYEIIFYSAFDILSFLLENGIIFTPEKEYLRKYNIHVKNVYLNCFKYLNNLVEKKIFIKFHPIEIAFSIISLIREIYGLTDIHILFERIYHFQFDNHEKCLQNLKSKIKINKIIKS